MKHAAALLLLLVLLACGGGSGGDRRHRSKPSGLTIHYPSDAVSFRVGVAAGPFRPAGGGLTNFSVTPPLPDGLALDPGSGAISGTPRLAARSASYRITADHPDGAAAAELRLSVTPPLPPEVISLAKGYAAERIAALDAPVKMAVAPDGRLFANELTTGRIRVIGADGVLRPDPFAVLPVVTGGERGLLGLALAPDFPSSGHVFVLATVDAPPVVNRVIRLTARGEAGEDPVVIVDGLPAAFVHNAGDIEFGPDGMLYVSIGDTGNPVLAQTDGSRAGRILRYRPDGTIPDDNPFPGDPEWCRGLRNSFDMTFHPATGGLFASENGPTFGDEINYIQRGQNYEWEKLPEGFPGSRIGLRITGWTPVIAPTGIAFVPDPASGMTDSLFVLGYVEADIRRLVLSGPALTDLDEEIPFLAFENTGGVSNKPLDAVPGPGGDLYVSTFAAIWRIERW